MPVYLYIYKKKICAAKTPPIFLYHTNISKVTILYIYISVISNIH